MHIYKFLWIWFIRIFPYSLVQSVKTCSNRTVLTSLGCISSTICLHIKKTCEIVDIPIDSVEDFESLDLSDKDIDHMENIIFPSQFININLEKNQLETWINVTWPSSLNSLYLSQNRIQSISTKMFPSKIQSIDLQNNQLCQITQDMFPVGINTLFLGINPIQWIEFKALPISLKYLSLAQTFINTISNLSYLTNLTVLILIDIKLTSLNKKELPVNLQQLLLDRTGIQEIASGILPNKLNSLSLGGNDLKTLKYFSFPASLERLFVDHNDLSSIESSYLPPNIKFLDYRQNRLTHINSKDLPLTLYELSIEENGISNIKEGTFTHLTNLSILKLSKNRLLNGVPMAAFPKRRIQLDRIILNPTEMKVDTIGFKLWHLNSIVKSFPSNASFTVNPTQRNFYIKLTLTFPISLEIHTNYCYAHKYIKKQAVLIPVNDSTSLIPWISFKLVSFNSCSNEIYLYPMNIKDFRFSIQYKLYISKCYLYSCNDEIDLSRVRFGFDGLSYNDSEYTFRTIDCPIGYVRTKSGECFCPNGFYEDKGTCIECSEGFNCTQRIDNGLYGIKGSNLHVKNGYWRLNTNLSLNNIPFAAKCPINVCLSSTSMDLDTFGLNGHGCSRGNRGALCASCDIGYYKSFLFQKCKRCPKRLVTFFSLVFQLLLCIGMFAIFVNYSLKPLNETTREMENYQKTLDDSSALSKVFLNFIFVMMMATDFNISIQSMTSNSTSSSLPFNPIMDWYIFECMIFSFQDSTFYSKYFIILIFPVILICFISFIYYVLYWYQLFLLRKPIQSNKNLQQDLLNQDELLEKQENSISSNEIHLVHSQESIRTIESSTFKTHRIRASVVLMYFFWSILAVQTAQPLKCIGWKELHDSFVEIDTYVKCSTNFHLTCQIIGGIFCLGYGLGIPLITFSLIYLSMKKVGYHQTLLKYRFLLEHFQPKFWYWDFIVCLRKLSLVLISCFHQIPNSYLQYQVLWGYSQRASFAVFILLLALIAHITCQPYQSEARLANRMEIVSLILSALVFEMSVFCDLQINEGQSTSNCLIPGILSIFLIFGGIMTFLIIMIHIHRQKIKFRESE